MFVVGAKGTGTSSGKIPWVAGVLSRREDVELVLSHVQGPNVDTVLEEILFDRFPIYLIEDHGFRFIELGELQGYLMGFDESQIIEDEGPIIYRLDAEFGLKHQGQDQMGGLDHIHLDPSFLRQFRAQGGATDPFDDGV